MGLADCGRQLIPHPVHGSEPTSMDTRDTTHTQLGKKDARWADGLFRDPENVYEDGVLARDQKGHVKRTRACKKCGRVYAWNNYGRESLRYHAKNHHNCYSKDDVSKLLALGDGNNWLPINSRGIGHRDTELWSRDSGAQAQFLDLATKFIATSGAAFRIVENKYFRQMCTHLNPRSRPLSRQSVSKYLEVLYLELLQHQLTLEWTVWKPALVTDLWTRNGLHFMNVCVQWIVRRPEQNRFELYNKSLGVVEVPGGGTTDVLKKAYADLVQEHGLTTYRPSVVTDHAANMKSSAEAMGWDWNGCCCHRLNLALTKTLDQEEKNKIVLAANKLRRIITPFRNSTKMWQDLKAIQIALHNENQARNPIQEEPVPVDVQHTLESQGDAIVNPGPEPEAANTEDSEGSDVEGPVPETVPAKFTALRPTIPVVTRWNSVYFMLERSLVIRQALDRYLMETRAQEVLYDEDWDNLQALKDVLETYKDVSIILEGETYVTGSLIVPTMAVAVAVSRDQIPEFEGNEDVQDFLRALILNVNHEFDDSQWFVDIGCMLYLDPTQISLKDDYIRNWIWGVSGSGSEFGGIELIYGSFKTHDDWVMEVVKETKKLVYLLYSAKNPPTGTGIAAGSGSGSGSGARQSQGVEPPRKQQRTLSRLRSRLNQPTVSQAQDSDPVADELSSFASITSSRPLLSEGIKDALDFWRLHQDRHPYLSMLAAQYLCIPASSASSERAFSRAGHVLGKRRMALKSSKISMLTYVRDQLE